MGYTTEFNGRFNLNKPLTEEHSNYLTQFAETRRIKRDARKTSGRPDPIRKAVGLQVGLEGGYFVGEGGFMGQNSGPDVINSNDPPAGQPGLWCQWVPTEDRTGIEWNGMEKFYDYTEWLAYLIEHFLEPWGYVLNGEVEWQGEDLEDLGKLVVKDNMVSGDRQRRVPSTSARTMTCQSEGLHQSYDWPRFWIDDTPTNPPRPGWVAGVDEEEGGIVAYFQNWDLAQLWVSQMNR
jgi:hypothetical protein